ncbi:MAG: hypothetical protein K2X87_32005 [Gemmataceae bacterium]|nr:hypothetical protein [Gemmataceae bacterium]
MPRPKFEMGKPLATPGALEALAAASQTTGELLARHLSADWGDLDPEDVAANDDALIDGSRIFSAYTLRTGVKIWVITEAADDGRRAATTLILPEEY